MPSTRIPLVLIALLALAGCAGLSGPGGTAPTGGESTTPGPAESPRTTVPAAEVVDFEDLSRHQQRLALTAIESGSVTANGTEWGTLAPTEERYLLYDGERFRIDWHHERNEAKHALDGVERVDAVEADAAVVAYTDLTDRGRVFFDAARSGGGAEFEHADAFPDALRENRYVGYDGAYYRLRVTVADVPVWRMTAEPVE